MAQSLGQLFFTISINGASVVSSALKGVTGAIQGAAQASGASARGFSNVGRSLIFLKREAMATKFILQELAGGIGAGTGVSAALRVAQYGTAFQSLTGRIELADEALNKVARLSERVGFPREELLDSTRKFGEYNETIENAIKYTEGFAKAASRMGLGAGAVQALTSQIAPLKGAMQGLGEGQIHGLLRQSGIDPASILKASGGKDFTGKGDMGRLLAERIIASMPGYMQYGTLTKGVAGSHPQGGSNAAIEFEKARNAVENILLPTGTLILKAITPVIRAFSQFAAGFAEINRAAGGIIGLPVAIGSIVLGFSGMVVTVQSAVASLVTLNASLAALAATSGAASAAVGAQAGVGLAAQAASGGLMARLGAGAAAFLPKLLKGGAIGLAGGTISNLVGNQIAGDGSNKGRKFWGGAVSNIGQMAAAGAGIGSIIPGLGTAAGAGAGALAGALKTWWDSAHPAGDDDAAKKTAENTERIADTLNAMHGTLMGGGRRAGMMTTRFEREINHARQMRLEGMR